MVLRLPAPLVAVLVGPSGAGKTTWAKAHFSDNEVVTSDELRAMVGTGEDDLIASGAAFELLHHIVAERARRGLTTVIDTLGLEAEDRARWIGIAHDAGLPVYAVVFDTPFDVCERRNSERSRPLPKTTLRKQFIKARQAIESIATEGFDGVHRQQPMAAVPPRIAEASTVKRATSPRSESHSFGLLLSRFDWDGPSLRETLESIASRAETAGFRDLWVMDHFRQIPQVGRPWEDIPEAYTALSYLAGVTERIRLGALVTGITHRHPVVLGKMVATLDVLSGGRAICGLGLAWDEAEHGAYGIDLPDRSHRYRILEDTLRMLPLLWGKGSPSFEGATFTAKELVCYPRPLQDSIPILVGGSGERRTLRLVARYADACNVFGGPERVRHKISVLETHCQAEGRDLAEIEVTHLTNALVGEDRGDLRDEIERLRGRNTSAEDYARANNAGTVDDLVALFGAYAEAGATHSIVAIPNVSKDRSLELFADVIAATGNP